MSRALVLARGRLAAEVGMVDTCTIQRRTGQTEDEFSGVVTDTYVQVYAGRCRLQQPGSQAQQQDVGEASILLYRVELQLPISATGLQTGDLVTITASAHDADLVGKVFYVRELPRKSEATARRVQVQERAG